MRVVLLLVRPGPLVLTVVVCGHAVLVTVPVPDGGRFGALAFAWLSGGGGGRNIYLEILCRRTVVVDGQLKLLARILERAMRDAVVEVHDQPQRHPDGKPYQGENAELEY